MKKQPAQPNQSLIYGIECLQTVIAAETPIGSREAARRLGAEHTRVNRILGTFCTLGLLEQTLDRRYRPGPGIHVLAAQSLKASGLLRAALPVLRKFDSGRLSLALGVLWNGFVCYFFFREPGKSVDDAISGRELFPAEQSSIGRIIAAWQSRAIVKTPAFMTKKEAEQLCGKGYAMIRMNSRHISIAVGVGAPVFAALALTGDNVSDEAVPELINKLNCAAYQITARLLQEDKR
jgi:DNA-binding IclR family transcriptional regulator